jgi:hypothetical protein
LTGPPIPGPGGQPQGAVRFEIATGGRVIGADHFSQSAYFREVAPRGDGPLETNNSIALHFGTLSGAGALCAPDITLAGVQLMPGNSPGTLLSGSDIVIEVDNMTVFDYLLVTGSARLNDGRLVIRLAEDFTATPGFVFDSSGSENPDSWISEVSATMGLRVRRRREHETTTPQPFGSLQGEGCGRRAEERPDAALAG